MAIEPVAWLDESSGFIYHKTTHPERYTPLYKAREWVGLTTEEYLEIIVSHKDPIEFCRDIEQRLKEKNT